MVTRDVICNAGQTAALLFCLERHRGTSGWLRCETACARAGRPGEARTWRQRQPCGGRGGLLVKGEFPHPQPILIRSEPIMTSLPMIRNHSQRRCFGSSKCHFHDFRRLTGHEEK